MNQLLLPISHATTQNNITIEGLRGILSVNRQFMVTGHPHNEQELLPMVSEVRRDILIMDINLDRENGLELTKKIATELGEGA